jgi:hypothetical protein
MSNTNTGGPAFPCPETEKHYKDEGMTLRDYFAAKVMQGFVSDSEWRMSMNPNETAKAAYHQADEMLKARDAK